MTPAEKIAREEAMTVLRAEEELAGLYGPVPDGRVYDLVLAITGSEEKASEAQAARWMARLRRGEKPDAG